MDQTAPIALEKPDPKVLLIWRLSNLVGYSIFCLIIFAILAGIVLVGKFSLWLLALGLIPLLMWMVSGPVLQRQWENWTFRVTPEALEMSHGWIFKQRRVVARDRIQHVDINSGPFDRKFGLVQVVVHTAGVNVGMIPGLAPERAERLRDELMAGRGEV